MISLLEIRIEKTSDAIITINSSSLFQGVLFDKIDFEYGDKLHLSQLKPYSQYLMIEENIIVWRILALNEEFFEHVVSKLLLDDFNKIYISHRNIELNIISKQIYISSYQQLVEKYYFGNCSRYITIRFATPTAFKSNGKYVFYPNIRFIFQSLMKKFDAYCTENEIGSLELLDDIEANVEIIDYRLRSYKFHLEGVKIPSFMGQITLKINGPQQMANIVHMLIRFAEYSGVGIKSAIGMGGINVVERSSRKNE